jgi:imidazole glycerol-phosphate synthase subunit HisH
MGNSRSVQKSFEKNNCHAVITNDHDLIMNADKIVLPGVGSFYDGMNELLNLGLIDILNESVVKNKKPFLGICLGMQLMANMSYENTETKGLEWIDAEIVRFDFSKINNNYKIPHVGWNNVEFETECLLYDGIPNNSDFYFVHSYHYSLNEDVVTGSTDYGYKFTSSICKDNIFGFQFHPEKSQGVGLKLISNFIEL